MTTPTNEDLRRRAEEIAKYAHACCICLEAPVTREISEKIQENLTEVHDSADREGYQRALREAAKAVMSRLVVEGERYLDARADFTDRILALLPAKTREK